MKYNRRMTQVLTVACKLKVSQSQAAKLDATIDAFVQALNWVNQNTPQKTANAVKLQSLCYTTRCTSRQLSRVQSTVVIGAGPAGLSAAYELNKQGYP